MFSKVEILDTKLLFTVGQGYESAQLRMVITVFKIKTEYIHLILELILL